MYRIAMCNKVNKMIDLWSFDLKNVMNTILIYLYYLFYFIIYPAAQVTKDDSQYYV